MKDIMERMREWAAAWTPPHFLMTEGANEIASLRRQLAEAQTVAIGDIVAERKRQIEQEGWTPEHDDEHGYGEIARAAAAYAVAGSTPTKDEDEVLARDMEQLFPYEPTSQLGPSLSEMLRTIETLWPWNWSWWKPTNRRRNLIKAAALIVAEIERLDRIRALSPPQSDKGEK